MMAFMPVLHIKDLGKRTEHVDTILSVSYTQSTRAELDKSQINSASTNLFQDRPASPGEQKFKQKLMLKTYGYKQV